MVYKGVTSRRKGGLQESNFKEKGWSTRGLLQEERVVYKGIKSRIKGGLQGDYFKNKGWSTRD